MNEEPEISNGSSTLPANQRFGDSFAGRRVVTIGGGSGTFSFLSHLKKYPVNISAIVTMSDSGGSSRRLMDEFRRQLPLGDLRMSLVALARNGALWREVFMHRFQNSEEAPDGRLGLEESLARYEQGIGLIKRCQNQLREAEQRTTSPVPVTTSSSLTLSTCAPKWCVVPPRPPAESVPPIDSSM